ncbi:AbrB/MazE/SpoVT family DNA-binding domain-containing protein [Methanoregula sp.]|uniref:AbrB/MazE/SpoVT family DNA-binding domain-containing protein n=1 Tax=Methanoregula sp. TaxID=2052170 RepID=UPI003BAE92BD
MPKNSRPDESIVHNSTSKGGSLRATIPSFIASQFDLKHGDKIRWRIEGDKIVIDPQKG